MFLGYKHKLWCFNLTQLRIKEHNNDGGKMNIE